MTTPKSASRMDRLIGIPSDILAADTGGSSAANIQAWWLAASESQRELMTFLSHRLARNCDTLQELLNSRNVAEVFEIQSRWAQQMLRDYSDEMTRILAIYSQSWAEAVQNKR